MSDRELISELLANILTAIQRIKRRLAGIQSPEEFLSSDADIEKLDGITMMLIAVSELLKRLDSELLSTLVQRYPEVDWKGAKGGRDFLSRHYFAVEAELTLDICQSMLAGLKQPILHQRSLY